MASRSIAIKMTLEGSNEVKNKINEVNKDIDELSTKDKIMGKIGTAAAAAGTAALAATAAVAKGVQKSSEWADSELTLARNMGISVETLQKYQQNAEKYDIDMGVMESATKRFTSSLDKNEQAINELGVATKNADGTWRDSESIMQDVIKAMAGITDETQRDIVASDLFGKSWKSAFGSIVTDVDQFNADMEQTKVVSEDLLKSGSEFNDKLAELKTKLGQVANEAMLQAAPAFTELLDAIMPILEPLGRVVATIAKAVAAVVDLANKSGLLEVVITVVDKICDVFEFLVGLIKQAADAIGGFLAKSGGVTGIFSSVGSFFGKVSNNIGRATTIEGYATGGDNIMGGRALVGENGPEMVYLPTGSSVASAQESRQYSQGDTYNITIDAKNVSEFNDIVRMVKGLSVRSRMA